MGQRNFCAAAVVAVMAAGWSTVSAWADTPATTPASGPATSIPAVTLPAWTPGATTEAAGATQLKKVVVSSDLDRTRDMIAPSLGAVTYTVGQDQIRAMPGGENTSFQNVLLRMPGVVADSFGQVHVRGDHANLTFRLNGVLLPEPLQGFGQEIDTRLLQSVTLIDGSLPAQFGFRTAGVVDMTTKTGLTLKSNELSIYGGSNDTIQPSFQVGGSDGRFDYFATGSYNHDDLGIENPQPSHHALHDYTNQEKFFGYFSYQIDDSSRLSLLLNASDGDFEIPNSPGVAQGFDLVGHPLSAVPQTVDSRKTNETENEQQYYLVLAYQKDFADVSFQLSAFTSYGALNFQPDVARDLAFQGVAGAARTTFQTQGVQFDASYRLNDAHTLRGGFIADYTYETVNSNTAVFPADADGTQIPGDNAPLTINDDTSNRAVTTGLYIQDEWHINEAVTLNFGARYDRFDSNFDSEGQLSPRVNLVWAIDDKTTAHFGYSRYFVPPPVQNVSMSTVNKFRNTTNTAGVFQADPPKVEKSNYFDAGISCQITKPLTLNFDAYYKDAHNMVDSGQFGSATILAPFNYKVGKVYGTELSAVYKEGGFSAYANGAFVMTDAHSIDSQQFLFDPDELAFIKNHDVHLDHESQFAGSAGASYTWKSDMVYLDILYENGLRKDFANTRKEPQYYPVNIGWEHVFQEPGWGKNSVKLRFDIVNLFDEKYQIHDGSGIGSSQADWGARRAFYVGLTYSF